MGPKSESAIQGLAMFEKTEVFIETGTFLGDTLARAYLSACFDVLHSIEYDRRFYEDAVGRFAGMPDVMVHLGSSHKMLRKIIDPDKSTMFYLDAHRTGAGGEGSRGSCVAHGDEFTDYDHAAGECPLLDELRVIRSFEWKRLPLIVIDDAQNFTPGEGFWKTRYSKPYDPKQWPSMKEITSLLEGFTVIEQQDPVKKTQQLVATA